MSIQIICLFLIGLFVLLMLSYKSYLCILDMNYLLYVYNCQIFSLIFWFVFLLFGSVSLLFLLFLVLFVSYVRNLYLILGSEDFYVFFWVFYSYFS